MSINILRVMFFYIYIHKNSDYQVNVNVLHWMHECKKLVLGISKKKKKNTKKQQQQNTQTHSSANTDRKHCWNQLKVTEIGPHIMKSIHNSLKNKNKQTNKRNYFDCEGHTVLQAWCMYAWYILMRRKMGNDSSEVISSWTIQTHFFSFTLAR